MAGVWPGSWFGRGIDVAPLRWVGDRSYAIYLWHYPIARLTRAVLPFWPSFLACLALSSALAWFSWHTVEHLGRRARARMDAAAGSGDSQVGMPEAAR